MRGLLGPLNSCLPTVTVNTNQSCLTAARRNLEAVLKLDRARIVVLGLTWNHDPDELVDKTGAPVDNEGGKALVEGLEDLAKKLRDGGKSVVLLGPIAEPGVDIASTLSRELAFGWTPSVPVGESANAFLAKHSLAISRFKDHKDVVFVRPYDVQCDLETCHYLLEGRSLYADGNHIAAAELPRFEGLFEQAFKEALDQRPRYVGAKLEQTASVNQRPH